MAVTKAILEKWMAAQKRHHLSDRHVQMARELGLNPDKLGKIDNHRQEPWKVPLPQFIEDIYFKRFKREQPETVRPLKQILKEMEFKRSCKKRKRRNGGNSVSSLPIQQQSKQRSHDMKRSLKAARFSDFAFLILTSCSVFIFHGECPFLYSPLFQAAAKNSFSYRLEIPFRCNVMTPNVTHRQCCKSMN